MKERWNKQTLTLLTALVAVGLLVLASMYMIDRQWNVLSVQGQQLRQQGQDIQSLRTEIEKIRIHGGVSPNPEASGLAGDSAALPPAFARAARTAARPDYARGDWLVRPLRSAVKSLTPLVSQDLYSRNVQDYVLESLLTRDPVSLKWQGLLASAWSISDDGLEIRYRLRPEARFSDGKPLTAADVVFSYDFINNPQINAPVQRALLERVTAVEALSGREVVFRFREPYYNSLALTGGLAIMAQHYYGPYMENAAAFNESRALLFGSGPYILERAGSWTPDRGQIDLERNPRYWGPVQPSFDRLLWRVIDNPTARLAAYRNGNVDLYGARGEEFDDLLQDQDLVARSQVFRYLPVGAGYSYVAWNQKRDGNATLFSRREARQAMTYLIDREEIAKKISRGYSRPTPGPFSPNSRQHDPQLRPRKADPAKAQALLRQLGYRDRNGDGVIENPQGQPFSFDLMYPQQSESSKKIVLALQDAFARVGIHLKPRPTEWSVMLERLNQRDFDATILGWSSGVESDPYQIFHSSQIDKGDNFVSYSSPEADQIIDQARATLHEYRRMALWRSLEKRLYEDQPYTFMLNSESLLLVDRRFPHLEETPFGLSLSQVPLEAYSPLAQQRY